MKYCSIGKFAKLIDKTGGQELIEDMIQIITVFSARLQGKRANKVKKMIKELLEDDKRD